MSMREPPASVRESERALPVAHTRPSAPPHPPCGSEVVLARNYLG